MNYEQFKEYFRNSDSPKSAKEINKYLCLNERKLFRYLSKATKEKFILFIKDRAGHPKKKPVKFYFINPIKTV